MPEGAACELSAAVFRLNEAVLDQALAALSKQHLEQVSYGDSWLKGKIDMEEAGRLILSIPYEKGWRVKLNGEAVEPGLFGGAFIAFDLQPGHYELEMEFVPYGKWAGFWLGLFSFGVLAVYLRNGRR